MNFQNSPVPAPDTERPLVIRIARRLRSFGDRLIQGSSLVPNDPVLNPRDFAWTALLRDNWEAIREEAMATALQHGLAPSLADISPDHRQIAQVDMWRSFFLFGYGYRIEENAVRCPRTMAVVDQIPDLVTAFFSILAPGTHIPPHRGISKALLNCHLALIVPRDGDVRMRVDRELLHWTEGEAIVFDDTYDHEVWNDSSGTRVVLLVQVRRPMRAPGRWLADAVMAFVRRSPFVQEARTNIAQWNAAMKVLDG